MQLTTPPTAEQFPAIAEAMHAARIDRYLPAAGGSQEDAFQLYLWNCALCEAFYLPLHISEVVVRNAMQTLLLSRLGEQWYANTTFRSLLDMKYAKSLDGAIDDERKQHGILLTSHHVVSAVSFGFWQHLLTKRFDRLLWQRGLRVAFPHLPNSATRQTVYDQMNVIRKWRNRIAHHQAIFDKGPMRHYQETLKLALWVSLDVGSWLTSCSKVTAAIDLRPVPAASRSAQ
jgi:hypothetical protein